MARHQGRESCRRNAEVGYSINDCEHSIQPAQFGIDYVAIGSDFDGGITPPIGLEDVSRLPALTLALLKHGYSPSDVKKILGKKLSSRV